MYGVRILIFTFLLMASGAKAQSDSLVLVSKNFKFQDGVFFTFEDFKNNQANLTWDTVYAKLHTNPQKLVTLVDSIMLADTPLMDSIWGISLGGIPYLNLNKKNDAGLNIYVGLKVRGNISYFSVDEVMEEVKLIKAYNPRTGVPFREGEVVTKKEIQNNFMLSFENGKIERFTMDNFVSWIEEDEMLVKTVKAINEQDVSEKLFKCLLIYDDRNPVYVPSRE